LSDISWIGSSTFMQGDYGTLQSKMPRAAFPWNSARDSGRPDTGRGGYPTCREWWSDSSVGLKKRVTEEVDEGLWLRISAAMKMLGNAQANYQE
ncbi:conjugal transfer protein TraG, partial [Escherichia coli]|nr:conjugal transfer protein TraG [Escherichia coli]